MEAAISSISVGRRTPIMTPATVLLRRNSKLLRSPFPYPRTHKLLQKALLSTAGSYKVPKPFNEKNLHYALNSPEREQLGSALKSLRSKLPLKVSNVIDGVTLKGNSWAHTVMPSDYRCTFAKYACASDSEITVSIDAALKAREMWREMPLNDRAAIFLRAAELVAGKYRYDLIAATMLGQGKNAWQAEIDAAAELADFFRFNAAHAQEIYDQQPSLIAPGQSGRIDYRPLEGFVYAVSPFNFTAIGGNLISAPAIMGNVVVWKPSPHTAYASYLVYKILLEAGLPPGVIQLVNGDPEAITKVVFNHPELAALHFTGSSAVFRQLYARLGAAIGKHVYRDYPRMVAETSGKNFHLVHPSADISNAVKHTIRSAFEFAGQKCSACSRVYLPKSQASQFLAQMQDEMKSMRLGSPENFESFVGPVIHREAFDRLAAAIDSANTDPRLERIIGGGYDASQGLYIQPTVYVSKSLNHELFDKELFGPLIVAYVYEDADFAQLLRKVDEHGGGLALTGSVFARDRSAIRLAENSLRYSAGNFYINCKTTGAVIGQQTFGGGRASGTNDKAGSVNLLMRFVSPRTIKEEFYPLESVLYPSNE